MDRSGGGEPRSEDYGARGAPGKARGSVLTEIRQRGDPPNSGSTKEWGERKTREAGLKRGGSSVEKGFS